MPGAQLAAYTSEPFHGDRHEETRTRVHPYRVDDRRCDHRHSRSDCDPELHQVPGPVEAKRGEGKSQGHLHCAEGVLPGEGSLLLVDRGSRLLAGAQQPLRLLPRRHRPDGRPYELGHHQGNHLYRHCRGYLQVRQQLLADVRRNRVRHSRWCDCPADPGLRSHRAGQHRRRRDDGPVEHFEQLAGVHRRRSLHGRHEQPVGRPDERPERRKPVSNEWPREPPKRRLPPQPIRARGGGVHEGTTPSSIRAPAAPLAGNMPRTPPALLAALALLSLLLPVRSAQQAIFAASFALALSTFGLWGRLFGRLVLGVPRLGPCSAVYLGQFAVLAAAAPVMAVNGLAAGTVGKSLPLGALVAPATLALVASGLRAPRPPVRLDLFALLALASVGLLVSIYSAHVSALGLDLHEHTAWIRQIVARGYVPLAEPGTGILADYPRGFHVLAGLWNAAGLSLPAGPFAKTMPFLQNALGVLALGEQMVDAQTQWIPNARRAWEVALGLAFFAYAFLLIPLVYPVTDLLGTPRFSSCGLLLLPVALIMIARVQQSARAAYLALAAAPLLAAWALVWNPIIPLLLVMGTVPIAAALLFWLRPPRSEGFSRRGKLAAFAACAALGSIVLVQDPWVVNLAAQRIPVCRSLVERAGLITFEEAVALGRATPREKSVRNAEPAPPCGDVRCIFALAGAAFRDALWLPLVSLRAGMGDLRRIALSPSVQQLRDAFKGLLPFRPTPMADYAGLPFVSFVAAG